MLPLLLAPAAISAVKSGYDWYANRKNIKRQYRQLNRLGKYENTAEGAVLSRVGAEGAIGPQARANIMGRLGAQTGQDAANASADYSATFRKRMGTGSGSVAGMRGLNEIQNKRMEIMGNKAADIDQTNEETKFDAQQRLAQGKDAWEAMKRAKKEALDSGSTANNINAVGGVLGAAAQGVAAYGQYKAASKIGGKGFSEVGRNFDPNAPLNSSAPPNVGLFEQEFGRDAANSGLSKYVNLPSEDLPLFLDTIKDDGIREQVAQNWVIAQKKKKTSGQQDMIRKIESWRR